MTEWLAPLAGLAEVDLASAPIVRFLSRLRRPDLASCPHLDAEQPATLWIASPDRVWCWPCALHVVRPIERAPERAWICDLCGQETRIFVEVMAQVADGGVTVVGNICVPCHGG